MPRVCIYPNVTSLGGVGTFRSNLTRSLLARGLEVTHDLDDPALDVLLVLAGTRNLPGLWRVKRRGVPIVQRLDGINWVQRRRRTSLRYHLRAEYGNWNLSFIRRHLADRVVYQSQFVRGWWEDWYGETRVPAGVIVNGVDLDLFTPEGLHERPDDRYRLLLVEGSLAGGLDFGLEMAVQLAERLAERYPMELAVAGQTDERKRAQLLEKSRVPLNFLGVLDRGQIPQVDRSAHLYFSAELNPPCPNSVIEALACGLPVVGFETGSLSELIGPGAGRVVPYGGDPWQFDLPDIPALAEAAGAVLDDLPRYRSAARAHAEAELGLERMVEKYLEVLLK